MSNTPANVVQVEVRSVYGNELIYPANFEAERFAAIAGTKTLTNVQLAYAEQLGFLVVTVPDVATERAALAA